MLDSVEIVLDTNIVKMSLFRVPLYPPVVCERVLIVINVVLKLITEKKNVIVMID